MAEGTSPGWAHTAGPFRAFEHRFEIRCTDEALGAHLDQQWDACRADVEAQTSYGLEVGAGVHRLHVGGAVVAEVVEPSTALRDLVRLVNRGVIADAGDLVVVHAAGAVRDGRGVLFPAPSESGKSTLVAALVRAGWGYLSDEAIGIDPVTLEMHPYPKPISLDPGSWEVLADLEPRLPGDLRAYSAVQWQVASGEVRPRSAAMSAVTSAAIVTPRFGTGNGTSLAPLPKAEAVLALADGCFSLRDRPGRALGVLARLVRDVRCRRLTYPGVWEAVRHLR